MTKSKVLVQSITVAPHLVCGGDLLCEGMGQAIADEAFKYGNGTFRFVATNRGAPIIMFNFCPFCGTNLRECVTGYKRIPPDAQDGDFI